MTFKTEINVLNNTKVEIVDVLDADESLGVAFTGNTGTHQGWKSKSVLAALRRIVGYKEYTHYSQHSEEFRKAVDGLTERNNPYKLFQFVKNNPEYISQLDKGMEWPHLYRVMFLDYDDATKLIEQGLTPVKTLESWGHSLKAVRRLSSSMSDGSPFKVIFKKKIPEKDRIACLECIMYDPRGGETEIVTLAQTYSVDNVHEVIAYGGGGTLTKSGFIAEINEMSKR